MNDTVIVGLFAFAGTCIGTLGGIMASNQLTKFRLDRLEKKMDEHNGLALRLGKIEQTCADRRERFEKVEKKIFG